MKGGYVYIMTNKPQGTLYIGVTSNLARRVWEHREGVIDGFTKRYGLKRLAHYEFYDDIRNALQREKNLKHWPAFWKLALVQETNPGWSDLYETLQGPSESDLGDLIGRARHLDARLKGGQDGVGFSRGSTKASCAGLTRASKGQARAIVGLVSPPKLASWMPGSRPGKTRSVTAYLENFLYFSRCGMTLSIPSRRFLSSS